MSDLYILDDDGNLVIEDNAQSWGAWFENFNHRRVAYTQITPDVFVSTVFLGVNHRFGPGTPILWETMAFGLDDEYQRRYTSDADARAGHEDVVALVEKDLRMKEAAGHIKNARAIIAGAESS